MKPLLGSAHPTSFIIIIIAALTLTILQPSPMRPVYAFNQEAQIHLGKQHMHNGIFKTLEEVMAFYDMGGGKNPNLDIQMKPLGLTAQEKKDIVEFLKILTGQMPNIERPSLP